MNNRLLVIAGVAVGSILAVWLSRSPSQRLASAGPMAVVSVPELSTQEQRGRAAFEANCASCHGRNAAGRQGIAPPLVHNIYEPDHHANAAFQIAVSNGVRQHHWTFGSMPRVEGVTGGEVRDITAYVRALQRESRIQ